MVTRREQLEGFVIARRRVLGVLLDPRTDLQDQGAPRPFRAIFASLAVAAVGLAAAVVVGMFHPTAPDGWRGDLISDGEGTRFVLVGGRLHPVLNLASAKLILGRDMTKADVPDSVLDSLKQQLGPTVGLPGAPEKLPRAEDLDLKDWSLCSTTSSGSGVAGKTVVEVGYPAAVAGAGGVGALAALATPRALLVQDEGGRQYVVADGMKYKVQDRNVLVAFNAPTLAPRPVKASWLAGLPTGDPLGVHSINGKFGAVARHPTPVGFDRVGMFGKTVAADGSPVYYLVSGEGLAPVSATTYELYQRDPRLAQFKFTETVLPQSRITQEMLAPASPGLSWPSDPPRFAASSQDPVTTVLCAVFDGTYDPQGHPHVVLSTGPSLPYPLPPPLATDPGSGADSGPGPAAPGLADVVSVRVGHGIIARDDIDGGAAGVYLITDTGIRDELVASPAGAAAQAQLGYDGVAPVEVPSSWLKLLPGGPALDPAKASQSPPA